MFSQVACLDIKSSVKWNNQLLFFAHKCNFFSFFENGILCHIFAGKSSNFEEKFEFLFTFPLGFRRGYFPY
jgi:hypothetical protein